MVDELSQPDGAASPDAVPQDPCTLAPAVAHVSDADDLPAWPASAGDLHLASGADSAGEAARDDEVSGLLRSADARDAAASLRDIEARALSPQDLVVLSRVYLEWAARDRDLAACDRADLISLLRVQTHTVLPRPR
jgi:hypothetical protein